MLRHFFALCTILVLAPERLLAQHTDYYALLGGTWASPLVTDHIVNDISVQQAIAPSVRAGIAFPIGEKYGVGAEGGFGWGSYKAKEASTSTDLGSLSTASFTANLDGPVAGRLRWRAGIGVIGYLETSDGIFQDGGPWKPLAMVGVDYRVPLSTAWDVDFALRVDGHRFTTSALEAQGFTGSQTVGRVFLGVGIGRSRL